MRDNKWVRLLGYVTGLVNQGLLLPLHALQQRDIDAGYLCNRREMGR